MFFCLHFKPNSLPLRFILFVPSDLVEVQPRQLLSTALQGDVLPLAALRRRTRSLLFEAEPLGRIAKCHLEVPPKSIQHSTWKDATSTHQCPLFGGSIPACSQIFFAGMSWQENATCFPKGLSTPSSSRNCFLCPGPCGWQCCGVWMVVVPEMLPPPSDVPKLFGWLSLTKLQSSSTQSLWGTLWILPFGLMWCDQRNLPSWQEPPNLIQDQALASTPHQRMLYLYDLQSGIRFLWKRICCDNALTPSAGLSQSPALPSVWICKSATVLHPVPSNALLCWGHDLSLAVANVQRNGLCSDSGSHIPSYPNDYWICLHLGDSPAMRSHCKVHHETLSWWHDGLANFDHTNKCIYSLMGEDILLSQRHVYCRLFQKNLPATYRSAAQVFGLTNIESLLVSMSGVQRQLAMQEAVKQHEDDSTLQKFFKPKACFSIAAVTPHHCHYVPVVSATIPCMYCKGWCTSLTEPYYEQNVRKHSDCSRSNRFKYQPTNLRSRIATPLVTPCRIVCQRNAESRIFQTTLQPKLSPTETHWDIVFVRCHGRDQI